MGAPRWHGCKESEWRNTVVSAYVRTGGKWSVIGTVCTGCFQFWRRDVVPPRPPRRLIS